MAVPLDALASYVPRLVIRRLEADAAPLSAPRDEHVTGALLFADVAGFSKLADLLSRNNPAGGAEELTKLLNKYFGRLIRQVHRHGGDVVKFAGDALLALWTVGEPAQTLEQVTALAAQCGLSIQGELKHDQAGEQPLRLRINVLAGNLRILELGGVGGRWELLLTGPPLVEMQTAEQGPEVGAVLASPTAWKHLASQFEGEPRPQGFVCLHRAKSPLALSPLPAPRLRPDMEPGLRGALPAHVLARVAAGQTDWLAELRQVTVLFVNLPWMNSTVSLAKAQSVMETIERILAQYQGCLNKLSIDDKGATAVAAFGLPPVTHEDDPVRAVLAARALLAALTDSEHAPRIGVTTGSAFCGSVGSDHRREYTVIGDTVNLAARLMQRATGRVLCDQATRDLAKTRFRFAGPRRIKIKGKARLVPVYHPLEQRQSEKTNYQALYGRDEERRLIEPLLDQLGPRSAARVVLIEGEAGIGKSSLVQDLIIQSGDRGFEHLVGQGDSIEGSAPYHVYRSVLLRLIDQLPDPINPPSSRQERLLTWLESEPDLLSILPLLNSILPLGFTENETTRHVEGHVRADNLQLLVVRLLEKFAAEKPLLLVLDDGQWFDSGSWAITRRAARQLHSVLLLLVTRPLEEPLPSDYLALREAESTTRIQLAALSPLATERLVCDRLGVDSVPEEVTSWIYQRAEGNPLYSEELAFVLRDSERLAIEGGTGRLACPEAELATLHFPNAVQGVIRSRLDRLDPPEQMALKTASVIGRTFAFRVLYHTYPIPEDREELPAHVDHVCRRDLISRFAKRPELVYAFKHGIIQDVAYHLMPFDYRRKLHQAVAEWYETADSEHPDTAYSLLAHHWSEAGVELKSRDYQEKAGDHALRNGAYQEAADFFAKVLASLKHDAAERLNADARRHLASLERRLAAALLGLGRLAESRQRCLLGLAWLGEPAPTTRPRSIGRLMIQVGQQCWHRLRKPRISGEPQRATFLEGARILEQLAEIHYLGNETLGFLYACLRMLNLAEHAGPSPELARALANVGLTAATIPCRQLANDYVRQARDTIGQIDHPPSAAWVRLTGGINGVGLGDWEPARTQLREALELYQRLGDQRQFGTTSTVLGGSYYFAGNFQEGLRIWSEHHQRAQQRDDVLQQAWGHGGCALNQLRLGDVDQSIENAEHALELFQANTDRISEIMVQGVLAVARLRQGNLDAATIAADAVFEKIQKLGRPTSYLLLEGYAAVVEVYLTKWEQATDETNRRSFQATTRAAIQQMKTYARIFPIGEPRYDLWRAKAAWLQGSHPQAFRLGRKSLAAAEQLDMLYEQALAHLQLGQHLSDPHVKGIHWQRAVELFTQTAAADDLAIAQQLIEQLRKQEG